MRRRGACEGERDTGGVADGDGRVTAAAQMYGSLTSLLPSHELGATGVRFHTRLAIFREWGGGEGGGWRMEDGGAERDQKME